MDEKGCSEYAFRMALVRILVDGYSLLHQWPELAEGAARHSEAARDALIEILSQYEDASGTPVTVFFDGTGPRRGKPKPVAGRPVEVIFSREGQTADDLIERAAHRFKAYGEVLVVTEDRAERMTVEGLGGSVLACATFIGMIQGARQDLAETLSRHNQTEKQRFYRSK